ncbi:hypothetical protein MIDIC_110059 [Alphaproteobacteria bacterium]
MKHTWINDQVERMNRAIKYATIKIFTYKTYEQQRYTYIPIL